MPPQSSFRSLLKRSLPLVISGTAPILRIGSLLIGLCVFVLLAAELSARGPFIAFDSVVVNAIHANTAPVLVQIMKIISLAGYEVPIGLTLAALPVLAWKRRWSDFLLLAGLMAGVEILIELLKSVFQRLRPSFVDPLAFESGFSFPSGHSIAVVAFYGLIAYFLLRRSQRPLQRALTIVIVGTLALLVGFSRLYLGLHYPSDVLAGFATGMDWLILVIGASEVIIRWWTARRTAAGLPEQATWE